MNAPPLHLPRAAAIPWQARWLQLLRSLATVRYPSGQEQLLDWLLSRESPHVLAFANAHAMNLAARDEDFFHDLAAADTLLRDGAGMALLLQLLNLPQGLNLNGTDFIPRLLQRQAGQGIALFGTRDPWLSRAREVVEGRLAPGARCVCAHGFLPARDYAALVREHRPRLVVLAMGMPRQEAVAQVLRAAATGPCLIVCGGAVLDFLGGRAPRAPAWMRRMGLEWAWRLGLEPRRLFGRYVLGNPAFIARSLRCASHQAAPWFTARG